MPDTPPPVHNALLAVPMKRRICWDYSVFESQILDDC